MTFNRALHSPVGRWHIAKDIAQSIRIDSWSAPPILLETGVQGGDVHGRAALLYSLFSVRLLKLVRELQVSAQLCGLPRTVSHD